MIRAYFDNNATTKPPREVVDAMLPYFTDLYVNASSAAGQVFGANQIVGKTKRAVGALFGSTDLGNEIVFTSGASESNSWAIKGLGLEEGDLIVSSAIEHPSVLAALSAVERRGVEVRLTPCSRDGVVDVDAFRGAISDKTRLVSIMFANNETGVRQPIERLAEIVRRVAPQCIIHCDLTQAPGRAPLNLLDELAEVDLASFSAHKFHGPKGIGGLFIRDGIKLYPLTEGEQEDGQRGGTINSPGAAGMAKAADLALAGLSEVSEIAALRDYFETAVIDRIVGSEINGSSAPRLPNTSSITIKGLDAGGAVDELARRGICIANGSACSSGSDAPSHVLTAMGIPYADAFQTLRISLSRDTTASEIDLLMSELESVAAAR